MLRLKSCPRCRGDIRIDRDTYGWYEKCIQCGYLGFLEKVNESGEYIPMKVMDTAVCLDDESREEVDELDELAEATSGKAG